jgi:hypothetical protein
MRQLPRRFIGRSLLVKCDEQGNPEFIFMENDWQTVEIMIVWQDFGFSDSGPIHDWRSRHHRNYYHFRTEDGRVWEAYLDRTGNKRSWQLVAEIMTEE